MATYAGLIQDLRRMLKDFPNRLKLGAAVSDTTDETVTLASGYLEKVQTGMLLEHDDGGETGAEQRYVVSTDAANDQFEAVRGFQNSTAATHANSTYLLVNPRWPYDECKQAIDDVLDAELFNEGLYDIVEHQVTSSSTTLAYNAPSTSCLEWVWVYQRPTATDVPKTVTNYTRYGLNVDTSLWSNAKVFEIRENFGIPGTDLYYVNCKHKLAVGTLTASQEVITRYLAAALLLEWEEFARLSGPNNQADRSVRPQMHTQTAAYWRQQASKLIQKERAQLESEQGPPFRIFRRGM